AADPPPHTFAPPTAAPPTRGTPTPHENHQAPQHCTAQGRCLQPHPAAHCPPQPGRAATGPRTGGGGGGRRIPYACVQTHYPPSHAATPRPLAGAGPRPVSPCLAHTYEVFLWHGIHHPSLRCRGVAARRVAKHSREMPRTALHWRRYPLPVRMTGWHSRSWPCVSAVAETVTHHHSAVGWHPRISASGPSRSPR